MMKLPTFFKVFLCITLIMFSTFLFARSYSSGGGGGRSFSSSSSSRSYSSYSSGSARSYSSGSSSSKSSYSSPSTSYSNSSGTARSYSSTDYTPKSKYSDAGSTLSTSSGVARSYSTPSDYSSSRTSYSSYSSPITNVSRSTTARRPSYSTPYYGRTVVYNNSGSSGNGLFTGLLLGNMMSNHNPNYIVPQGYTVQSANQLAATQGTPVNTAQAEKVGPYIDNVAKIPKPPMPFMDKVFWMCVWGMIIGFLIFFGVIIYRVYKNKTKPRITHMSY